MFDQEALDKDNNELQRIKSDERLIKESSKYSDDKESEKQIEPQLSQNASEINLPPRKPNDEISGSVGGLNNLIRRMTGFADNKERENSVATPRKIDEEKEKLVTDREDESKLEIPAFLRRQAN